LKGKLKKHFIEFYESWKTALSNKTFRTKFFISTFLLAVSLYFLARFLDYNEARPGFSFADPLLIHFMPVNVTWITFILIYGALIVGLLAMSKYPRRILIVFQSYALVSSLRLITIYFLPLNAPIHIIPLKDPFVEFFTGSEDTLLRDLFFSGHTATMFLLALTAKHKSLKWIFVVTTIFVAACVLIQHVHYTIDVLTAPFFAYTSYRISRLINKKKKSA
jgi:hypothetical protein